ncbi:MAG: T9SS C-terminal target domain-containing protein [Bacteroidetes bacterium]|nr:MAG: T9SS C-terminal target domain-containing protein [Bacteroidota bacterium]
MKNKITTAIAIVLFCFFANAQISMKKYSKRMFAAKSVEERQKLHDDFMPKYYEQMRKKYPENMQYWGGIEYMKHGFQSCEFAIEGKLLEHPSAYQVAFDTVNKQHYNYRSIIITKIIKGSGLKIGDVIQVAKDFSQIRSGGRGYNDVNHSATLMLFLNKSQIKFFDKQFANNEEIVYLSNGRIFENSVRNDPNNIGISFDTAYQFLKKKYRIIIKDSFDISDPMKYNEILKRVNVKLGTNHPLKGQEINLQKSIILDTIGEGMKYYERKLQNEKSKKYVDSLHQDLLDFKRDSAKFPERKMRYKRNGGWKLPTKSINNNKSSLGTETTASVSAATEITYEIKNQKTTTDGITAKNYIEFDVMAKTNGSPVMHAYASLRFSYNPQLFGSSVKLNNKATVTQGPLFSVPGNNYSLNVFDHATSVLGVFQEANYTSINIISIPGLGTTTSISFNYIQLPANQSVVVFHVKLEYDWSTNCNANTKIDFTNKDLFTLSEYYATDQTNSLQIYSAINYLSTPIFSTPSCTPSISGITYSSIALNNMGVRAGSDDFIIVSGNGFGNSICGITFKNANDGGATEFTSIEDIISWTDTEIRAKVPSLLFQPLGTTLSYSVGGSGTIKIKNALGNQTTSTQSINVPIAFNNFKVDGSKYRQYLAKQNCTNGIEFTLSSSIPQAMRADVERVTKKALLDWSTALGLNFRLQETAGLPVYSTLTGSNSIDGINLISFKILTNLGIDMGTIVNPKTLNTNNGLQAYNFDTDIEINSAVANWNFDLNALAYFGKSDFYFTMLHELGHTIGLDHVININKETMHWKDMSFGVPSERATLSTTTNPVSGGLDIKTASQVITWSPILGVNIGTLNSANTTPTATVTSNISAICPPQIATLSVTPNYITRKWFLNGFDTGINTSSLNTSLLGFYSFVGGRDGCTTTSNVITITQTNLTPPTITASKLNLCGALDNTTLTTSAPFSSYTWRKNNAVIPNSNFNSFNINSIGNYDLIGSTNGCTTTSNVITITQPNLTSPTISASKLNLCGALDNTTLTTSDPFGSYTWRKNNAVIPNSNFNSFNINSIGNYDLIGNTNGCTTTSNVIAITQTNLTTPTISASKLNLCGALDNTTLTTLAPFGSYTWRKNNAVIPNSNFNSFNINTIGNYDLIGSTNGCTTTSNIVTITIGALPTATSAPIIYSSITGCTALLSVTSANTNSYQWYNQASIIMAGQAQNNTSYALDFTQTTPFVRLTNACGNTDVSFNVKARSEFTPSALLSTIYNTNSVCNATMNLSNVSPNSNITWIKTSGSGTGVISSATNSTSLFTPLQTSAVTFLTIVSNGCSNNNYGFSINSIAAQKPIISISLTNNLPVNGNTCVSSGTLLANVSNGFTNLVFTKGGSTPVGIANANPVVTGYNYVSNSIIATATNGCGSAVSNSVRQPNLCSTGCIPSQYSYLCSYGLREESEEISKLETVLFPNPANEELTIVSQENITYIEIYDTKGTLVQSKAVDNMPIFTQNVQNLTDGLYVVKINTSNGTEAKRFTVQK